ncbi:DUF4270 domain-containing protein [Porphyromonadaceae bacterium W3.11]|nr:DUF4270 domain-containing protein [Porphyromonadaceae bacterium W3.11]
MRNKIYAICMMVFAASTVTLFNACDNVDNSVGADYLPDYTKSRAINQDFKIDLETVSADMSSTGADINGTSYNNIYVSSSYGFLGAIPNKEFGSIECEYLTQFRCPEGFKFSLPPIDNKIDSAFITIYYNGYSGDPIAPIEISAYQLNKPLDFNKYSITDVSEYTNKDILLGKVTFQAKKGTPLGKDNSIKAIKIPLDQNFGQNIYDLTRADSEHFANQSNFDKFFPGVYLTTSAGVGSMIRVYGTALTFYFQIEEEVKDKESPSGKKIVNVTKTQELVHTSEVPQLSRFANGDLKKLIKKAENDTDYTYIKSPAGVLTQITIPTEGIRQLLEGAPEGYERILNSVQLSILGENQPSQDENGEVNRYALPAPEDLLLIPEDSVKTFFSRELTDLQRPYTAFLSQKSIQTSMSFDFGNISSVVLKHIENKDNVGKDLKLWVVPVDKTVSQAQGSSSTTSSISNLVFPAAIKIRSNEENRTIKVYVVERKVGAPF